MKKPGRTLPEETSKKRPGGLSKGTLRDLESGAACVAGKLSRIASFYIARSRRVGQPSALRMVLVELGGEWQLRWRWSRPETISALKWLPYWTAATTSCAVVRRAEPC